MFNQQGNFSLISRDELKRLAWDEGKSDVEIAQMYGVTANVVNSKRKRMNLIHGQITAEQENDIARFAQSVRSLPYEAIQEMKIIAARYQ